jgi:hypothetical protein
VTSWTGVLSVSADVAILVALAAAVARRNISQLARLVIATFVFACAWLAAAGFDAARAPGWTMFVGGAVIVASIMVITTTLHLWTQRGDDGDVGPGDRGAHGGGGPRRHRPDAPQPRGGGNPSWWPDFERQLASYVAEREGEERAPAVLPASPRRKPSHGRGNGQIVRSLS